MKTITIDQSVFCHFIHITDPRKNINIKHNLIDILLIGICAVLCGCEHWEEIENFAKSKETWFKKFLKLPNGIPSHDRIRAVFIHLDPHELEKSFRQWVNSVLDHSHSPNLIHIDGKTSRGSKDPANNKKPLHLVSAFSSEDQLVLGQVKTNDKSNEITAIPKLIDVLNLNGSLITIDAIGCQKETVKKISSKGAGYVIALKENQKKLFKQTKEAFAGGKYQVSELHEEEKHVHGRTEKRSYALMEIPSFFTEKYSWEKLSSLGIVKSERLIDGVLSAQTRYYISSLSAEKIKEFSVGVRNHWQIENKVHWQLDVSFAEDQCRKRAENAAENFSVLRKISLNLLKQEKSKKFGIKSKRKLAGWDESYLEKVLFSVE